ncbi:beta strand repeat-containing protein [Bartonella sp. WD16.2]|uniref:beta strand repeat-containing protein n=1 Tax=Bartonella sp. WD16.2 TaxID=1933904 RepID=UPI00099A6BFD|nr:right-handed parallel beta-helix repeat-containing protein [Bartonella sp. WD16.2]AQX19257.1 hypothetical protein BWD162_001170 [Bartonella sp. WD16.2]
MVMRRVLKHHVCLCVLSTAIVAGLALITSQKVYAQAQNCGGWVQSSEVLARHHDEKEGKIVCNSSSGTRTLEGERTIDMSDPDEGEEAVKITGSEANITIGDNLLTVTDSKSSDKSAIRVEQGARLTLKDKVSITDVQKVMEVEGKGSVITVNGGTFRLKDKIGARKDGGRVMIEVKDEGRIVFDKRAVGRNGGDLTISGGMGAMTTVTGIEVSGTGGEVEVRKGTTVNFERVTEAIKIKSSGTANIRGEGIINITGKSTGIKMEGSGKADVMSLTINGSRGATVTGAEVSSGTLELTKVTLMQVTTGAKVTGSGTLKVLEGTITGGGSGMGVEMDSSGTVTLTSVKISEFAKGVEAKNGQLVINGTSTITVTDGGTGLNITGGSATMMGGEITGSGGAVSTGTGVKMESSGTVTLTSVGISQVMTGVEAINGQLVINGTSTITVTDGGTGVKVSGSATADLTRVKITVTGMYGTGLNITGGSATMTGGSITGSGRAVSRSTGVKMDSSGTVTLNTVNVSGVQTGVEAIKGILKVTEGSIEGKTYGVKVTGGNATMTGTTITGENGTGVWMEGSGTAKLTKVKITGGSRGVWVQGNGRLEMTEGSIEFTGAHGVYVRDNATAKLTEVKITGSGTGVEMRSSGTMTLTSVNISQVQTGVDAVAGQLVMNMGTVEFTGNGYGVKVSGTATSAELTKVKITGGSQDTGKGVYAEGKKVTMSSVDISNVRLGVEVKAGDLTITGGSIKGVKWGINMEGGKKLVMDGGTTISFTDGYGVKIQNNVTAELTNVKIMGSGSSQGTGVTAMGTGSVTMNMVEISKVQVGVNATGGTVTITGGWIREVEKGIDMTGTGTLTVSGTEIQFKENGYGVRVGEKVTSATLTKVTIRGTGGDGTGTGVHAEGGNLTVKGGSITNVQMGIDMAGSGTLTVEDGTRIEFKGTHGVKVGGSVTSATLTGVMIRGDGKGTGTGVHAEGGKVTVTGGWIREVQTGIDMAGKGTLKVEDGTRISFKGTHGVKVGATVQSATLTGVTIRGTGGDGTGTGVHAEGGNLTVKGGSITNVLTGIDMSGSGTLKVEDGTRIEFKGTHGVKVGGSVTSATLTNVTIRGNDGNGTGTGVEVKAGDLTVKGGSITNVLTGIDMAGKGTLTVEDGTRIEFKGTHGVGVWGDVTVSLTGTKIMGEGNGSDGSSTGIGVIMAGKTMTMDKVDISGVAMGVYAGSGKLVIREGTTINFAKTYGVKVGASVTSTELTRVTIVGEGKGTGVYAGGKTMMITGGSITNVQMGVRVMAGELEIKDGTVITVTENGTGVGVWGGTATAELTEVTIKGEGSNGSNTGIGVIMAGSSGTMKDVRISGVEKGVYVMRGEVTMDKVDISGVQTGIEVESGTLEVLGESGNSTINFTGDYGVKVGASVKSVRLTDVRITGGDQGSGTGVWANSSEKMTLMLDKVGISGVVMGVNMLEGEMLEIKEGTISFKAGYGVYVGDKVKSARLMGTQITGDGSGYGVWAMGKMMTMDKVNISNVQMGVEVKAGNLTITGGSIKEVQTGIAMLGNGMLKVEEKTEIQFRNGYGVYVGEKVQSATLMGTVITGGKAGYGVYAKGGRVMVSGGSIKEVGMGIRVLAGDLTVRDGTTIHFIGDGAGVYVEEKVKSATLTKVTIRGTGGDGSTGVIMESSGTMTDVDISNVQMGVTAMGGAVTITGGSIKEVEKGIVMIGDGMLMVKGKTEIQFEKGDGYGVYMEGSVNASLMDVTITGEEKKGTGVYAEGGRCGWRMYIFQRLERG